jgi:AcrR family transcriptional regulator
MTRTKVKRRYQSARRREQADLTRARIAESARRLFAAQGYASTSIEQIAADAGVAAQTFYATYGSKRAVLFALIDSADAQTDVPGLQRALASQSDPLIQLALVVEFCVRFYETQEQLIAIAQSAGSVEPDLAKMWREGEARRRHGQRPVIDGWARRNALRDGLTVDEAADILWSMTGADCHRLFVKECGWPIDRFQEWLTATLAALLLR